MAFIFPLVLDFVVGLAYFGKIIAKSFALYMDLSKIL